MKYKQASILFALAVLCVFFSCAEKENAPQEIAVADAGELPAAEIAEEAEAPSIQQASTEEAEEPAFAAFPEPLYFEPLAAGETLAIVRIDVSTMQILAISQERSTYRLIHELSGAPAWFRPWFFTFSDNARSAFLRSAERHDNRRAPFYHIDGENGAISYLFDVHNSFVVSSDGRFVAFIPASETSRNTVGLFSVEERDVIAQFEVTLDKRISLQIAPEGISNFRIFNIADDWPDTNAEGVLDTENLTLLMNEISGEFLFEGNEIAVPVQLNNFPRLRYSLNIDLPLPAAGSELDASEPVNVYSAPDFSSEVIQSVGKRSSRWEEGYFFRLVEIGEEAVFDGITSHWAYVRLLGAGYYDVWVTNTYGWVFLGLLNY